MGLNSRNGHLSRGVGHTDVPTSPSPAHVPEGPPPPAHRGATPAPVPPHPCPAPTLAPARLVGDIDGARTGRPRLLEEPERPAKSLESFLIIRFWS